MEMKDTLSSCSDSEEQELQQMQNNAKNMKQYEFGCLCSEEFNSFKSTLFHNMDNLEKLLNKELLHEKDSKSAISSIKKCVVERALHEKEILKRFNDKKLLIQECKVQKVKALDASSGNTNNSGIVTKKGNAKSSENDCNKTGNDQSSGNESNTSRNKSSRSGNECSEKRNSGNDTDIRPSYDTVQMVEVPNTTDYNVFAIEKQHTVQLEFINDTYVMKKNDSNVTSKSLDMSHNVRKV
ncbi:hypothetical protein Tco_1025142 [Tanacetum coccineum]